VAALKAAEIYVSSFPSATGLRKKTITSDAVAVMQGTDGAFAADAADVTGHPKQRYARALAALRYGLALTAVHASPEEANVSSIGSPCIVRLLSIRAGMSDPNHFATFFVFADWQLQVSAAT